MTREQGGGSAGGYPRFLRNQPVYLLSSLATGAVSFLLLPIYTRSFLPADFGRWSLFLVATQVFAVLLTCGLDSAAIRRWHAERDAESKRESISRALSLAMAVSIAGAALGMCALWLGRGVWTAGTGMDFLIFGPVIAGLESVLCVGLGAIRAESRALAYGAVSLARVGIQMVVSVVAALLGSLDLPMAAGAWLAGDAVAVAGLLLALRPRMGFNRAFAGGAIRYGLPMLVAGFGNFVLFGADRFFLASFRGLQEVAVYSVAYKIATILEVAVIRPFAVGWAAGRFEVAEGDEGRKGYVRALALFLVPAVLVFALVSALRREIVALVAPAGYENAVPLIPILLCAYLVLGLSYPLNVGVMFRDRPTPVAMATWMAVLINTLGNLALIPSLGATGAAFSTVAGYGVLCLVLWRSSAVTYPIRYPLVRFGAFMGIGCGLGVLSSTVGAGIPNVNALIKVMTVAILVTGLAWRLGLIRLARGAGRCVLASPAISESRSPATLFMDGP